MPGDEATAVTVAVLKSELRHLDERAKDRHEQQLALWASHKEDHDKHAEQFETACTRITALEHWRTQHKSEVGTLAKINAGISAAIIGIAELVRWLIARGSPS